MFPKVFETIKGYIKITHKALSFHTNLSNTKVVNLIKKVGLTAFLTPDNKIGNYDYIPKLRYTDSRIDGIVNTHNGQCCSFTKTVNKWFLFPFSEKELKAVGISIDDALGYIKRLNDLKVGFKYLYFGYTNAGPAGVTEYLANDDKHWFAVPMPPKGRTYHYTYLHWIFLRYLVNSYNQNTVFTDVRTLPYYNFPRIFTYLIEDLGVRPWKALMYTHAASGWYSYYSLAYSESTNKDQIPDLGISAAEFKAIWAVGGHNTNSMLTTNNIGFLKTSGITIELQGKHDPVKSTTLVSEGKMKEFVEYMESIYYPKKTPIRKSKAKTDGKKKVFTKRSKKVVN